MKMEKDKYIQDLAHIKNMMENSSRFLSLSGLSGILAGVWALLGAYAAWQTLLTEKMAQGGSLVYAASSTLIIKLIGIAIVTLVLSLASGIYFTRKQAAKQGRPFFDITALNLLKSLATPLITGGLVSLLLVHLGLIALVAPAMLVFYGLALVSASKFTLHHIQYLGFTEIALGLAAGIFVGHGLFFWAIGFGVCHIIYGTFMYYKYERN
jgi:hypothetical protein